MKKTIAQWIRKIFGSLLFLGYIPFMPGTIGSLVTAGCIWYWRDFLGPFFLPEASVTFWFCYLIFCAVCIFLSNDSKGTFGTEDSKHIIIDECAGMVITCYLHPLSLRVLILGFLLFRFYDIVKPFPVHNFEEIEDGVGITMDDVIAGVLANASLFIIIWTYHVIKSQL